MLKGVTVNLNGHKLCMASFDGEGTITDTTTGGELHVDIASGEMVEIVPMLDIFADRECQRLSEYLNAIG